MRVLQDPYCTAADCSMGFHVELFVNLADNPRLDAADFTPFGRVRSQDMPVLDALYAGYGECADVCDTEQYPQTLLPSLSPTPQMSRLFELSPYCLMDNNTHTWLGVNLTRMLSQDGGWPYLHAHFPKLDAVRGTDLF